MRSTSPRRRLIRSSTLVGRWRYRTKSRVLDWRKSMFSKGKTNPRDFSAPLDSPDIWELRQLNALGLNGNVTATGIEPISGLLAIGTDRGSVYLRGDLAASYEIVVPGSPRPIIKFINFLTSLQEILITGELLLDYASRDPLPSVVPHELKSAFLACIRLSQLNICVRTRQLKVTNFDLVYKEPADCEVSQTSQI